MLMRLPQVRALAPLLRQRPHLGEKTVTYVPGLKCIPCARLDKIRDRQECLSHRALFKERLTSRQIGEVCPRILLRLRLHCFPGITHKTPRVR